MNPIKKMISHSALWALTCLLALAPPPASAQKPFTILTRAEATDYRETSHYSDVIAFLSRLKAEGAPIRLEEIGTSAEGRKIPLVIVAKPMVKNAVEARKKGKLVIYLQANIHGGEVEGKEAVLILLRELAKRDANRWLDRLVLLIAPIYNCDGNDKLGPCKINRSHQDGPDPVGDRPNGQGLDLNRDCIKAETPEMQGALKFIYNAWNPEVMMDLHTTDGTRHGFQLTYSPPLNPNTEPSVLQFARDRFLQNIKSKLLTTDKMALFDYGNVEQRAGERVFATFGEEGRYVTNYVGLRNRIAILSEAASFLPFKTRVHATLRFVEEVLNEAAKNAGSIKKLLSVADRRVVSWGEKSETAPELGVRFDFDKRGIESIPLEKSRPENEIDHQKAPVDMEQTTLPIYDRFKVTKSARFPSAYLISPTATALIELLKRHGIQMQTYREESRARREALDETFQKFHIESVHRAKSPFQGHRLVRLEGTFTACKPDILENTIVVKTSQPLGILVFHLLEPESLDGVAAWDLMGTELKPGDDYTILKRFSNGTR